MFDGSPTVRQRVCLPDALSIIQRFSGVAMMFQMHFRRTVVLVKPGYFEYQRIPAKGPHSRELR